jgi:hypothetical protein
MSSGENDETIVSSGDQSGKIQALRDMIMNAERTIQSARAMLLQIEGKKKTGRPRKDPDQGEGTVVQGTFDGQFMSGADGKQYPVPANYASKSKLVEGDMLKLTITPDGSFLYKQVGPVERRHAIGIVSQDDRGNYQIVADGKLYRVLLASVTYFKLTPGDEVAILLPRDMEATFASIENVLQKGALVAEEAHTAAKNAITANTARMEQWKAELKDHGTERSPLADIVIPDIGTEAAQSGNILDEWIRDMEALEKETARKEEKEEIKA